MSIYHAVQVLIVFKMEESTSYMSIFFHSMILSFEKIVD